MSKQPRERTGSNSNRIAGSKHDVWAQDHPAWVWLKTRVVDAPGRRVESQFLIDEWCNGKPSAAMLRELPKNVAELGVKRFSVLCQVRWSEIRAQWILRWLEEGTAKIVRGFLDDRDIVIRLFKTGSGDLTSEFVQKTITAEAKANNAKWFIRFGKAMEIGQNPRTRIPELSPSSIDRIAEFMVRSWFCDSTKVFPPLCYYTDQALADVCKEEFPTALPTCESVRKWRQRLALVRPGPPVVKEV